MKQTVRRLLLLTLLTAGTSLAAESWPEIEAPPRAKVQVIADDVKYNGVPMRIRQFTSDGSVEAVLAFYQQRWSDGGKLKLPQNNLGEWRIIGRQSGDFYQTVQVKTRSQGGSEGLMGISRLPSLTERPSVDTRFPRMPGSQVLSDVTSFDDGKAAKTLILKNEHSVDSNASYYRSMMPGQDWRRSQGYGDRQNNSNSQVMYFERNKESAHIVINADPKRGGTVVVVNIAATAL